MRVYEVQPGDSPASIAAEHAGCKKCAVDLLGANPHKPIVRFQNGFKTFRDLTVRERLNLPDKWFDGSLDSRPPAYFAALPYVDGVTPSTLGDAAAGVLGDYAALDTATAQVGALVPMPDPLFVATMPSAAAQIDSSVSETFNGSNPSAAALAQQVRTATDWARQRNADLSAALLSGDTTTAASARFDAQTALTTALGAARITLQVFYSASPATPTPSPDPATGFSTAVAAAAQAVATAMAADPNYCSSIAQTGSAVNAAVHAFKSAWNSANPNSPVPINTGNYEQATADVLTRVLGMAPPACAARTAPTPPMPLPPQPVIVPPQPEPQSTGLSTGEMWGIGLAGAGVVGTVIYFVTQKRRSRFRYGMGLEDDRQARPRR